MLATQEDLLQRDLVLLSWHLGTAKRRGATAPPALLAQKSELEEQLRTLRAKQPRRGWFG